MKCEVGDGVDGDYLLKITCWYLLGSWWFFFSFPCLFPDAWDRYSFRFVSCGMVWYGLSTGILLSRLSVYLSSRFYYTSLPKVDFYFLSYPILHTIHLTPSPSPHPSLSTQRPPPSISTPGTRLYPAPRPRTAPRLPCRSVLTPGPRRYTAPGPACWSGLSRRSSRLRGSRRLLAVFDRLGDIGFV